MKFYTAKNQEEEPKCSNCVYADNHFGEDSWYCDIHEKYVKEDNCCEYYRPSTIEEEW